MTVRERFIGVVRNSESLQVDSRTVLRFSWKTAMFSVVYYQCPDPEQQQSYMVALLLYTELDKVNNLSESIVNIWSNFTPIELVQSNSYPS